MIDESANSVDVTRSTRSHGSAALWRQEALHRQKARLVRPRIRQGRPAHAHILKAHKVPAAKPYTLRVKISVSHAKIMNEGECFEHLRRHPESAGKRKYPFPQGLT